MTVLYVGVLLVIVLVIDLLTYRKHVHTDKKIDVFMSWVEEYMTRQGPIQENVLSLIARVGKRTTDTLNKVEQTVKDGAEAAGQKAAEAIVTAVTTGVVPPSGTDLPIPPYLREKNPTPRPTLRD